MFPQIRCNYPAASSNPFLFYILCKGCNAGKPSLTPWANSFVIVCPNSQYRDFYFWLASALFLTGKFKVRLRGTAVPFINVNDVRDLFRELAPAIFPDWSKFQELINTMDKLQQLKTTLAQQITASGQLQKTLLHNYFCGR